MIINVLYSYNVIVHQVHNLPRDTLASHFANDRQSVSLGTERYLGFITLSSDDC